ncbi:cadmium-translocating P-type ATPase [Alkalihalophilus pseudofirmus]|uniref:heavy metal translocating P-type ATPase n=1 Tax=Alkalihalophilus pseudofirmus TaxID=79885 RepID=UPI0009515D64|nr:cadmium-translocating P-type ATPase [Alkalihalophilus pseudofirmus]
MEKCYGTESCQLKKNKMKFVEEHLELTLALISGSIIIMAWLLQRYEYPALSVALFLSAYVIGGYFKAREGIEDALSNKTLNVELLMIFAAIGSAFIGYWVEGAILIFIFSLSGALETYTMNKSHREISSLMDLRPETATVLVNGEERKVGVDHLVIGNFVLIKPGERIPADGKIVKGTSMIDEAALSGEALPLLKTVNDEVFTGTVNKNGLITIEVTKKSEETLFQKIIELVQQAKDEKTPSQQFIEKFEGPYVKIVLLIVGLMLFLPHYFLGWSWSETWYRAMVMLVVASPCALVASIMPATLSAISNGARKGILFKGGVHLENLAALKAIAFDKTGTLTKGKPSVTDLFIRPGIDKEVFLQSVYMIEKQSTHPLAEAVVHYVKDHNVKNSGTHSALSVDSMHEIPGCGVEAEINDIPWKVGKRSFIGDSLADSFYGNEANRLQEEGKTLVYVADDKGVAGLFAVQDTLRETTKEAVKSFKEQGLYTIMLTGDQAATAAAVKDMTQIDTVVAGCLPEGKVMEIKKLKEKYHTIAMVGDGINDAPALAAANIGVAMGGGTDAAIETSDIVLMKNDLSKIAEAVRLSKRMNRIIKQNIVFSIAVIALLIISNFMGHVSLPLGVIGHEGSTILVILNGLRLLRG